MSDFELTKEEKNAIASLKRLAKRWPDTLWLHSASGTLCIMRKGENGEHVFTVVGNADIDNDGGDW